MGTSFGGRVLSKHGHLVSAKASHAIPPCWAASLLNWKARHEEKETMAQKSETTFAEGDFVVYPTHGVGRILGTEERDVGGAVMEMLVVRFEQDRMTLRVPMEKAKSLGLRTLSSRKQMDQAITTLQGKARVRRTMWSRRAQEYETKIKSGDPVSIARGGS